MTRKAFDYGEKWGSDNENKGRGTGRERVRERASRWEERVGCESGLQH